MAEQFFLFDGTAFIYRAYYAIQHLSNSRGEPTNAAFGFARVLMKILRQYEPACVAVVFDAPGKTFRHDRFPAYKATRQPTPEDLIAQLPLIDKIVDAFDLPRIRISGVEADDVLGTMAQAAARQGFEAVIVSGDKDLLQLVDQHITVFDPHKGDDGKWYGPDDVRERYGVEPERVIDVLGLMGDSADNVPGVRGIGEKTARKLLEKYGSMAGVYEHIDELKGKQRQKLEEDRDIALLSRELVTIKTDVEFGVTLDSCRRHALDRDKVAALFEELEFQSLADEFRPQEEEPAEKTDYRLVLTADELRTVIAEMRAAGTFAVDTETTSVTAMRAELVGISLSCQAKTGYYIPIGHTHESLCRRSNPEELFPDEVVEPLPREEALELLRPLLEDPEVGKVGHNIKYDMIVFHRAGVFLRGLVMDTMVASYLTDPSRLRHNLGEVSLQYLKRQMIPISDLIGKGSKSITFDRVPIDDACEYACEDADIAGRLFEVFRPILAERGLGSLHSDVELPLVSVLTRMELNGIAIDRTVFDELKEEIGLRLKELEAAIFEEAGGPFLISSPKQLQEVLFERLGLKPGKKTKTGYSTDAGVLDDLARSHPLPGLILEFRTLEKLRGTYVEALPKLVHPETGRLHTSFNQSVAATGRLSSSDPNLQNIPVRTEIGRRIRQGFVPGRKDSFLISADYSQIELRVLAHLSGDELLTKAFMENKDVHGDTAARVFCVAPSEVTPEMRRQAKAVNFGIVYGISAFGLARNLGISNAQGAQFIEQYFDQYKGVHQWLATTIEQARDNGYVETLLKRRRYITDINSANAVVRKAAERVATNTPVQGTAADIIKIAMVRLNQALEGTEAQMLLQVHDELIVEVPAQQAAQTAQTIKTVMEEAMSLDVPLLVDVNVGKNWSEIH